MSAMQYFHMVLEGGDHITINGPSKIFFSHNVNRFPGGLFLGPEPSYSDISCERGTPLQVPEETELYVNVIGNSGDKVSASVRGLSSSPNRLSDNVISLSVNFRSRVGAAFLDVVIGASSFTIVLDVCPTKIDYDANFNKMLEDIQTMSRGLLFDWLKSSFFAGKRELNKGAASDVEFISALHDSIDLLSGAVLDIDANSNRDLKSHKCFRRIDQVTSPSPHTIAAVHRGLGRGSLRRLESGRVVRETLLDLSNINSTDTVANRWLKQQLELLRGRVVTLLHRVENSPHVSESGIVLRHLRSMVATLTRLLDLSTFEGVKASVSIVSMHPVIARNGYYRRVSELIDRIRSQFTICSSIDFINSRQISELYEQWCFLKVASLIGEVVQKEVDPTALFAVDEEGLRIRLRRGAASQIRIRAEGGSGYSVTYNREFRTITGVQRPDIVVQVDHGRSPSTLVILDAKYRIAYSSGDKSQSGSAPVDAINALHRYRDAIYVSDNGRSVRPVVVGAVLFPPSYWDDNNLRESPFWQSIDLVGIGAVPLRPDNDSFLRHFLESVLCKPYEELIRPGLPFEPYESCNFVTC